MPNKVHCNVTTWNGTNNNVPLPQWKDFAEWIKQERLSRGLSQAGAAQRAGINRQQWYRIENAVSGTTRETVVNIATALSLDSTEALNRAGFGRAKPITEPQTVREMVSRLTELGIHIEMNEDSLGGLDLEDIKDDIALVMERAMRSHK